MKGSTVVVLAVAVVGGLAVTLGRGSPADGMRSEGRRIGAGGSTEFEVPFRGGERACVIVRGDHKPVENIRLEVYEGARLVAEDEARENKGDFVTAIWYPPRDATYRIRIYNPGKEYNECYIVLK
jgi:hypothetical protein